MRYSFLPLILIVSLSTLVLGSQKSQDIILLINGGVSEDTVRTWIETRSPFTLSGKEIEELQKAGATAAFIEWLRTTGRVAREPVSESQSEKLAPSPNPGPLPPPTANIPAQEFSVDVQLVNVVATVGDKKENPVTDLKQEDFLVYEDGKLQQITNFSADEEPMSVGILVDISGSMEDKLEPAQDALKHFLNILRPDDEFFIYTFNDEIQLAQDFTSDRKRLSSAIESLYAIGGTALYDVLIKGLQKISQGKQERKAILLISDGMDTASGSTFENVVDWARRTEVPIYSIGLGHTKTFLSSFFSEHHDSNQKDFDPQVLIRLAEETGGRAKVLENAFHHHGKGKVDLIDQAVKETAVWLKFQYELAYRPSNDKNDGGWRSIEVETRRKDLKVNARKGYYASTNSAGS